MKEELSAGLCDDCENCVTGRCGDGVIEPFTEFPYCKALAEEVIPVLEKDKWYRVTECEKYVERQVDNHN